MRHSPRRDGGETQDVRAVLGAGRLPTSPAPARKRYYEAAAVRLLDEPLR